MSAVGAAGAGKAVGEDAAGTGADYEIGADTRLFQHLDHADMREATR